MFYRDERLALIIDGANFYGSVKALGWELDYKSLKAEFMRRGKLLRASYYTTLIEGEEFSPVKPLVDWLDYNGYTIVTKIVREFTDTQGRRRIKGSMDVDIAVDAMALADHIDHLVLFTGDGGFVPLVHGLQRKGVKVSVCSTIRTQPQMVSDELRRICDNFIELDDLRDTVGRDGRGSDEK